jgi:hypothetical protein
MKHSLVMRKNRYYLGLLKLTAVFGTIITTNWRYLMKIGIAIFERIDD